MSEVKNFIEVKNRYEFRSWLEKNSEIKTECWVYVKKGCPKNNNFFWYIDAVEEALCFGWIDSIHKNVEGLSHIQKFGPRRKNSHWSELNKERCRRLEKLNLMTSNGRKKFLEAKEFYIDDEILNLLKKTPDTWQNFIKFPDLYQRVRIDTIQREKNRQRKIYEYTLKKFIDNTKQGIMFGEWNDYGRLLDY